MRQLEMPLTHDPDLLSTPKSSEHIRHEVLFEQYKQLFGHGRHSHLPLLVK
jgi:hypothetical protein